MMCALSFIASAQTPGYVPTDGLVAWYDLNGDATDSGPSQLNGLNDGAIATQNRFGQPSCAMFFSGQSFIQLPTLNFLEGLTISMWVKEDEVSGIQGFISKYDGDNGGGDSSVKRTFNLYRHGEGAGYHYYATASSTGVGFTDVPSLAIATTEWVHLAAVFGLETIRFYVNGVFDSEYDSNLPSGYYESDVPLIVGGTYPPEDDIHKLRGALDDLGIWDRELTQEEVAQLFNAPATVFGCTDTLACNFEAIAEWDDGSCIYPPVIDLGEAIETCEESVTLDAGPGFGSYLWSTGDTSQTIEVNVNGNYSVELGDDVLTDNSALSFDGINDFVDVGDNNPIMNNSSEATISAWINSYDNATWRAIATRWNNYGSQNWWFGLADNGRLHFGDGSNSVSYSNTDAYDNDGNWYYVTVTKNEHSINYYSNGVHVGSATSNVNVLTDSSEKLLIGAKNNASGSIPPDFFHGLISTVEVWDRTLSQEEIVEYHNCSPTGYEAGLVGYWKFNEGSGSTAIDNSGNGNDGAINGATYSDDVTHSDCANCSSTDTISVIFLSEGCTDDYACNYDTAAQCDDGSCDYSCCPGPGCCDQGLTWNWELSLCQDLNPADINLDGCVQLNDLLDLLSAYGDCGAEESAWQCGEPLEYQGYDYETVLIGEQCWFAENLRAENYRNGDVIPMVTENEEWLGTMQGARCWHDNDSTSWDFPGFLYNGYAVEDSRLLCPQSWHVGTDLDWAEVEISHGLEQDEAYEDGQRGGNINLSQKMRDQSWGLDVLGFGVLPGGYRSWQNGNFSGEIQSGAFWSNGSEWHGYREFHGPWVGVARGEIGISEGLSVRCIKDTE